MRTQTKTGHQQRTAFTLLELLVVIVIISVLAALLFPVVSGIFINVGNKEVLAEFTQLESAIAAFNSEMGANPYSSIILSDPEAEWTGPSKARIRKIWPEFDFKNTDFDDDTDFSNTEIHTLTSSEALVFFLGGIEQPKGSKNLVGFSKNPFQPFDRTSESRVGPFFKFDPSRLVDQDGDGFYEYLGKNASDSLEADPMAFASNNNGQGYDDSPGAVNHYLKSDGTTPWRKDSFQLIDPGQDGSLGFDTGVVTTTWSEEAPLTGEQADNLANFSSTTLGN